MEAFDRAASNPHFAWEDSFVAESSGRIVGFAWGDSCPLQEREKEQNTSAELKEIVIGPDVRRQGIGTRLLKGVESRTQTQGKIQMYVEADVLKVPNRTLLQECNQSAERQAPLDARGCWIGIRSRKSRNSPASKQCRRDG